MAKKFGKVLLLTAAAGTAAAAVFYFLRKKEHSLHVADEDDYDDFSDALEDEDTRSYVPLNTETAKAAGTDDAPAQEVPEEAGERESSLPSRSKSHRLWKRLRRPWRNFSTRMMIPNKRRP